MSALIVVVVVVAVAVAVVVVVAAAAAAVVAVVVAGVEVASLASGCLRHPQVTLAVMSAAIEWHSKMH